MLCEKCNKNPATVHYRYNDNGSITELHLCSECAQTEGIVSPKGTASKGYTSKFGIGDDYFGSLPFSSLFSQGYSKSQGLSQRVCPGCGLSENELRSGGKLGCAQCYDTFSDIVDVMLRKMHMSNEYKGKAPEGLGENMSLAGKIEKLRAEMQTAVENQEYEQAAKIRDAIRRLESTDGGDTQ